MPDNDTTIKCVLTDAAAARLEPNVSSPPQPVKRVEDLNLTRLRSAAAWYTRDVTSSFDIVHNVYVKILELPQPKRDEIGCLEAYALRAVRNEAFNWRRARNREVSLGDPDSVTDERGSFERRIMNIDEVNHLLEKVPPKYRTPFVLCRGYDYRAEDVAELLGVSVAVVWKRVQRALEIIQREQSGVPIRKSRIRDLFRRKEQK
jgi:RNA polymerase sigma factor (sigma-70 family)